MPDDRLGGCFINRPIDRNTAPKGCDSVGHIGSAVSIYQAIGSGNPAGVIMFDNNNGGFIRKIAQNIERIVCIGQICLSRVFTGLKKLDIRCQKLSGLDGFSLSQHQIAIDQLVKGGFLTWIFTISESFFNIIDNPEHFFIKKCLAFIRVDKTDLHLGGKVVIHYGSIHFFQILSHRLTPSLQFIF